MGTKIGLISDVHAKALPLKQALEIFEKNGVDSIFCAGDIAGYGDELDETIKLLEKSQCYAISGNHDVWFLQSDDAKLKPQVADYLSTLTDNVELEIEGKLVYMVHAHPPKFNRGGIRLLDIEGNVSLEQKKIWSKKLSNFQFDILIVGHSHQVFAEKIGGTLVINPGSTCFNHSCAILQLPEMSVEFISLSGKNYTKVWNWGTFLTE